MTVAGRGELPGVPMHDGFNYQPRTKANDLRPEAKARVQACIDDVNRCRLVAAGASKTYVIGAK